MKQPAYSIAGAILGIVMFLAASAQTGTLPAPEDLLDNVDISALAESISENLPPELELPNTEDWQIFWNRVEAILQSQSLEDMPWLFSTVQQACAYLDADPATQQWADWLRQRLDYFEMADNVIREVPSDPAPPPVAASSPPDAPAPAIPATSSCAPSVSVPSRTNDPFTMPGLPPAKAPVSLQVETKRHSLVRDSNRWQQKMSKRAAPANASTIIPRLKKVFRSEGLPPELVWMAEVESSLNPAARSPVGALGLFQLMPVTACRFGLRTGFFDERKNPEKSARAAAQYLKILYRTMGSWPLALAAYNAGEGRVGKLVKHKKQPSFEGIAADLPMETQMYVPKVMALIAVREKTSPPKLPGPAASNLPSVLSIDAQTSKLWNKSSAQIMLAIRRQTDRMHRFIGRKFPFIGGVPKWPTGADCKSVG